MRFDWRTANVLVTFTILSYFVYKNIISPALHSSDLSGRTLSTQQSIDEVVDSDEDRPRLADALLIGVSKCGSTALMFFLGLNPRIRALVGEIQFLCDEDNYPKGLDFYYSKLPKDVEPNEVVVERDGTCWRKNYAERVYTTYKKLKKDLKIILVACDPVNRVVSWYVHGQNNPNSGKTNLEFSDVAFDSSGEVNPKYSGIQAATYDEGFEKWLEYFPRDKIHVVNGDRLKTDPYVELHDIERFLGVDHVITRDNFYFNETKGQFCKRFKSGTKIVCMPSYKGRKHPDLGEKTVTKLREYFAPHDARFEKLVGKEIEWTTRD